MRSGEKGKSKGDRSLGADEALRITRAQLWRLSRQHMHIQEDERRRIAADLHNGPEQTLSLVKLTLDQAAADTKVPANIRKSIGRLSSQVKSALAELRGMAMNLRPSILDDLGIVATLAWYFREIEAAFPKMKLERDISVSEADVPDALKISIFRIVQEATASAVKHAKASRISVGLTSEDGILRLQFQDNGKGLDLSRAARRRDSGHSDGLQSTKARAELCGGTCAIQSAPAGGTRISVTWNRVGAVEAECPVGGLFRTMGQALCKTAPTDDSLSEDLSICLTCVKTLAVKRTRETSS